jgi:DNA-binding NtrC family response regulator
MSRKKAKILILDDEPDMVENLRSIIEGAGYETIVETEGLKAIDLVKLERPDLVITDLRMPVMDGLTFLERVKSAHPEVAVIVLTGFATVDSAVEAMKKGASDYLSKPFSQDELLFRISKALAWSKLTEENRYLREQVEMVDRYGELVGQSLTFREILGLVDKVAATDARVLVVGESGTGKELIARTIHRRSLRRAAAFFAINCGALTETLLESELFGHERGAFTGAVATKKGIFEVADGGTLFLDEVSETSLSFQAKLLRIVEEGEFLRVGGTCPLKADVRLISSSNRDLHKAIAEGRFREDLFYRLSVFQIHIPPLRERVEDIPPLAAHFLEVHSRQIKKKVRGISAEAMKALTCYSWPGNIRELENVIERAVIMVEEGEEILPEELPGVVLEEPCRHPDLTGEIQDAEREVILRTLRESNWNRSLAAKRLGIGRRTLYDKLSRLGIVLQPAP